MHSMSEMLRAGRTTHRGVRYWETEGLLGPVERSSGSTRRYSPDQMDKARIIAAAQVGGFDLDTIRKMLKEYGPDVREALLIRLRDRARACLELGDQLPVPGAGHVEYDL